MVSAKWLILVLSYLFMPILVTMFALTGFNFNISVATALFSTSSNFTQSIGHNPISMSHRVSLPN